MGAATYSFPVSITHSWIGQQEVTKVKKKIVFLPDGTIVNRPIFYLFDQEFVWSGADQEPLTWEDGNIPT